MLCARDLAAGSLTPVIERSAFYPPLVPCLAGVLSRVVPSDLVMPTRYTSAAAAAELEAPLGHDAPALETGRRPVADAKHQAESPGPVTARASLQAVHGPPLGGRRRP